MSKISVRTGDLGRYLVALLGSAGSSGAQFLLTLVLLRSLSSVHFGQFAFLWLVAQFIWAFGGSLFAAPLARIASQHSAVHMSQVWQATTWMQLYFSLASMVAAFALALSIGQNVTSSLGYAAMVLLGGLRLYGRVAAYSHGRQKNVAASDCLFTTALLFLTAWLYFAKSADSMMAYLILAVANALGMIIVVQAHGLGRGFPQLGKMARTYAGVWSQYSSWSLLGVIATETTSNAHSYIVNLAMGPAAFAPIAASGVLIRPAMVGVNALSEFERARIAPLTRGNHGDRIRHARNLFRAATFLFWVVTVVLTYCVLTFASESVFGPGYSHGSLVTGAWLWTAFLFLRILCQPEAVEMQARGAFAELAWPRIWSAPFSVGGALVLVLIAEPVWSLAALCLGEAVSGVLLLRAHRQVTERPTA